MKTLFIGLIFLPVSLFATWPTGINTQVNPQNPYQVSKTAPPFSEANARAIYWINLIDQQQYSASWQEASGLVQDVTSQEQWAAGMEATRKGFGSVNSRKLTSHQATDSLPGGTRGHFLIIKYETNFSRKPGQIETVTMMTEGSLNLWKVVSYRVGSR